jgi:hypothetical protein
MPSAIGVLAVVAGCSSPNELPSSADASGDAVTESATDNDASSDVSIFVCDDVATGPNCNDLPRETSHVEETRVASDPPAMTGGTIVEGLWELTGRESGSSCWRGCSSTSAPAIFRLPLARFARADHGLHVIVVDEHDEMKAIE